MKERFHFDKIIYLRGSIGPSLSTGISENSISPTNIVVVFTIERKGSSKKGYSSVVFFPLSVSRCNMM
jgi:hypothetical protein